MHDSQEVDDGWDGRRNGAEDQTHQRHQMDRGAEGCGAGVLAKEVVCAGRRGLVCAAVLGDEVVGKDRRLM